MIVVVVYMICEWVSHRRSDRHCMCCIRVLFWHSCRCIKSCQHCQHDGSQSDVGNYDVVASLVVSDEDLLKVASDDDDGAKDGTPVNVVIVGGVFSAVASLCGFVREVVLEFTISALQENRVRAIRGEGGPVP